MITREEYIELCKIHSVYCDYEEIKDLNKEEAEEYFKGLKIVGWTIQ